VASAGDSLVALLAPSFSSLHGDLSAPAYTPFAVVCRALERRRVSSFASRAQGERSSGACIRMEPSLKQHGVFVDFVSRWPVERPCAGMQAAPRCRCRPRRHPLAVRSRIRRQGTHLGLELVPCPFVCVSCGLGPFVPFVPFALSHRHRGCDCDCYSCCCCCHCHRFDQI
jgi:hypothetical protein